MELLARFWRLCRATFSGWLDDVEDPARSLDLSIHELEDGYRVAREKVVLALANKKRLERSIRDAGERAGRKRQEARAAVEANNPAGARRALEECRRLLALADRDGRELLAVAGDVTKLQAALARLEERIAETQRRRRDLGGQLHAGEAKMAMGETAERLACLESSGIGSAEAKLLEHVEQLHTVGEARMELAGGPAEMELLNRELSVIDTSLARLQGGEGGGH